jgi:hypothetical protein
VWFECSDFFKTIKILDTGEGCERAYKKIGPAIFANTIGSLPEICAVF